MNNKITKCFIDEFKTNANTNENKNTNTNINGTTGAIIEYIDPTDNIWKPLLEKTAENLKTWDWLYGRTPQFERVIKSSSYSTNIREKFSNFEYTYTYKNNNDNNNNTIVKFNIDIELKFHVKKGLIHSIDVLELSFLSNQDGNDDANTQTEKQPNEIRNGLLFDIELALRETVIGIPYGYSVIHSEKQKLLTEKFNQNNQNLISSYQNAQDNVPIIKNVLKWLDTLL